MPLIRLNPGDNVAVTTTRLDVGATDQGITACDTIPVGHKIALAEIPVGGAVRKYAQTIGYARQNIAKGAHVHTHQGNRIWILTKCFE